MTEQERVLPPGAAHSRRAAFYLFIGFLASLMPMPFNLVAVLPLGFAVWSSIQTQRALGAAKAPTTTRFWSGIGLSLTVLLLLVVAIPYAFYSSSHGYQDCLKGANTQTAKQACEQQLGQQSDLLGRILNE